MTPDPVRSTSRRSPTSPGCASCTTCRPDLPDHDVAEIAFQKRRVQTGNDFLPPHLQRVVVISCVLRDDEGIARVLASASRRRPSRRRSSASSRASSKYVPQLVSWNGARLRPAGAVIPRRCSTASRAACFWDTGDDDRDFRYNNYINRFHERHLDLMDVLALYRRARRAARRGGAPCRPARQARHRRRAGVGELPPRRDRRRSATTARPTCVNTYLLYLRFQLMRCAYDAHALRRGVRPAAQHAREARRAALEGVPVALEELILRRSTRSTPRGAASRASRRQGGVRRGRVAGRARGASGCSRRKSKFDSWPRKLDPGATRPAGASRAARTSASAAAAPRSTPTSARRWRPSSAGWRTASSASARSSPETLLPIVYGPEWGYRHRARLSVRHVDDKRGALVGFRERHRRYVAEMRELRGAAARTSAR